MAAEPEALRNLIVNYIPTTIDEVQLRQIFEQYGPIETIKIIVDRETRQSKGYGFVKYRHATSATASIQYLNGYPLMNKRLKVAYANAAEAQKLAQMQAGPMMQNPAVMQSLEAQQTYLAQQPQAAAPGAAPMMPMPAQQAGFGFQPQAPTR